MGLLGVIGAGHCYLHQQQHGSSCSGRTEFCWAFSCYLVLLFLYWASVPGWTNNNALPAQSPVRWQ